MCPRVRPCVPCVSRLPPVSFYRYGVSRVSRVCPGSPRCLFTDTVLVSVSCLSRLPPVSLNRYEPKGRMILGWAAKDPTPRPFFS